MMKRTHFSLAILFTIPIIMESPISIFGLIGSTLPDADLKIKFIKHRTITHSLITLTILSILTLYLTDNLPLTTVFTISYLSHIVGDSFTKHGVPIFYPLSTHRYGLKLITTNKLTEAIIYHLTLILIPISIIQTLIVA